MPKALTKYQAEEVRYDSVPLWQEDDANYSDRETLGMALKRIFPRVSFDKGAEAYSDSDGGRDERFFIRGKTAILVYTSPEGSSISVSRAPKIKDDGVKYSVGIREVESDGSVDFGYHHGPFDSLREALDCTGKAGYLICELPGDKILWRWKAGLGKWVPFKGEQ